MQPTKKDKEGTPRMPPSPDTSVSDPANTPTRSRANGTPTSPSVPSGVSSSTSHAAPTPPPTPIDVTQSDQATPLGSLEARNFFSPSYLGTPTFLLNLFRPTDDSAPPDQPRPTTETSPPNQISPPNQSQPPGQPQPTDQTSPPNQSQPTAQSTPRQSRPSNQTPDQPGFTAPRSTSFRSQILTATINPSPVTSNNPRNAESPIDSNNPLNYQLHSAVYTDGTHNAIARRRSQTPSTYTLERNVANYLHNKRESTAYEYYPGTESAEYDWTEERTDMYNTNLVESTAYLIKGSLGAGILSMHEAYMNGGLWTSLVTTIIIGLLISYAMVMLINAAQSLYSRLRISKLSYPDLAEAAAGTAPWVFVRKHSKACRYTVDIIIFFEMCGTCCVYQIIIAYTLKQMLEGISMDITQYLMDIRLYILIITPFLIMLCMIRNLKLLAPFALLADIFVGMYVISTLYYSIHTIDVGVDQRAAWQNVHGFIRFIGICMYCTSGITVALPVENNMRRPKSFRFAMQIAMAVVVVLVSITGFFGYWAWGEECKSPITTHMPLNTFTTILQFLLVLMLNTTFAVQFWVPFRIIWHYLARTHKSRPVLFERIYRFVMALLVTALSMLFPTLIPVMIFLGQFCLGFVTFIFPAFIDFLVNWEQDIQKGVKWRNYKNVMLLVFGVFLSVSSFYSIRS